jgi:cyclopropane fatty-acyl-phospholipid synthase-like methyltransferase
MLDFVKQLFENNVISEEMKSEIETAWQSRIQENRDHVTAELREEFAQKYEHDKQAMVEAVDNMIFDRHNTEISE